jgi:hypothetical protein
LARIRSIKPEIRISEKVNSWPVEIRYFWIMLWGYVDDHGRGRDNAKLIVADSYPLDDDVTHEDVERWLCVLADSGVIVRYEVDGSRFLAVKNWSEHQKPSHPARSVIPPIPADSGTTPEGSGNPREDFAKVSANGSPEQGAGSSEQGAGPTGGRRKPERPLPPEWAPNDAHKAYCQKERVNVDFQAERFRNHAAANDRRARDWDAAFRNWLLKAEKTQTPAFDPWAQEGVHA